MIDPPEYAGLINPIVGNAFAMRYVGRKDFVKTATLDTGPKQFTTKINWILVEEIIATLDVCEALMFVAPFVKLTTPVPPDYAAELMVSRLTVSLEGETVLDRALLEPYLVAPPFRGADSGSLVFVGKDEDSLLGTCRLVFLPNGGKMRMLLEDIPAGTGSLKFIYGAVMGLYTTRAKQGCLYEVGELRPAGDGSIYPGGYGATVSKTLTNQWSGNPKAGITGDKLERAYGDVLQGLLRDKEAEIRRLKEGTDLREKEAEIRRLKEDAELREKAEKRRLELEEEKRKTLEELEARKAEAIKEAADWDALHVRPDQMPLVIRPEGKRVADARADHIHAPVNFEAALARAKKRLIRWGIIAALAFIAAAIAIRFLVL